MPDSCHFEIKQIVSITARIAWQDVVPCTLKLDAPALTLCRRVVLQELKQRLGRRASLDDIPDSELDGCVT